MPPNSKSKKKIQVKRLRRKKLLKLRHSNRTGIPEAPKPKKPAKTADKREISPGHAALLSQRRKTLRATPSAAPTSSAPSSTSVAAEPIKRLVHQEKIDKARAEQFEKLPPALKAKVRKALVEQEAKIKTFADNLPESDKAAFRKYAEDFRVSRLMERIEGRRLDTGLDDRKHDFARDTQEKLGPEKTEQFRQAMRAVEQAQDAFRDSLDDDDAKDTLDAFFSTRMANLQRVLHDLPPDDDASTTNVVKT